MKKVLITASVISFIEWFNKENIEFLHREMGCEVHIACNMDYMDDTDPDRTKKYLERIKEEGIVLHNINFARNPFTINNYFAYRELRKLINANQYDLIHCHTPVVSMLTRLAARKARNNGSTVMYSCHGFHFHNTAPKKNWIIYYPIERWLSRFCDYLITINKEDFARAQTFSCRNVRYIPSVGVDIHRFRETTVDREAYKKSIGVPPNQIMLLSIGEMIERKNHEVIIKALGRLQRKDIFYVICGKGPLKKYLEDLAKENGISENVIFLGFRTDIPELCNAADISALPSKIEGLGLAGIEAMAAGIPLIASNVHGILDYVIDGKTGFTCAPDDTEAFAKAIETLATNKELRESMEPACLAQVEPYEINNALSVMWDIYKEVL